MPKPEGQDHHRRLTIIVRDERLSQSAVAESRLVVTSSRLTARELIVERLTAETLEPGIGEPAMPPLVARTRDAQEPPMPLAERIARALGAFEDRGFVLLIDERRITRLDEAIFLRPDTVATFLRLA